MSFLKDKLPAPPFKFSTEIEALNTVAQLLYGMFTGGRCIGGQEIPITSGNVLSLEVPSGASSAIMVLTCNPGNIATLTPDQTALMAKFSQTDTRVNEQDVSPMLHMPLGHMGILEIKGSDNLKNFRIKLADNQGGVAGHSLKVEYFA